MFPFSGMQNKSILDTYVPGLSLFYKHLHSAFECQLQCHNIMRETLDSSSMLPLCFLENAASITFFLLWGIFTNVEENHKWCESTNQCNETNREF